MYITYMSVDTRPAVFVTGATGTVGSAVLEFLLDRGERAIAGVRRETDAASLPAGAEWRVFEFGSDRTGMRAALDGCDRLFLMRPPPIEDVDGYLFPLIDVAMEVGVRQIVFLSLQGVQHNTAVPHHRVERYLETVGAPFTFLRPNFFMQNLSSTYREGIRDDDEIFVPAGRSFTAFIDARDIGAVAAAVLTDPRHIGEKYTLSGEQTLSYHRVARILSEVLGRAVRYARPSEADYLARLAARGAPADYIAVQRMIYRVVRLNASALPNRAVRRLTGRPATSLREFAERERSVWMPTGPSRREA